MSQERIACAAMKIGAEVVASLPPPARHHSIIRALYDCTGDDRLTAVPPEAQGFLTNTGRFVGREEAFCIARDAGQIINKTPPSDMLFSEDLW